MIQVVNKIDGQVAFTFDSLEEFNATFPNGITEEGWEFANVIDESDWDDGQPSEYDEWQDYYGGDDWDHGQYDDY
tara:strand:- start:251 stop:475 length:225 start_codon:yes stop_codon:yes gene_type:complete